MQPAYIAAYTRTPIGRYGGALASVRPDDLAAIPIRALIDAHPGLAVDDVVLGATNQAGEDNRNVGRMASLLAGLAETVPASTVNRLCGSGMDAVASAARLIAVGDADVVIAGGVESMSRAPFVIPKAETGYPTTAEIASTTLGWRLINPKLVDMGHTEALGVTAENVAEEFDISRSDQDAFAVRSQERAVDAIKNGRFAAEITPVVVSHPKGAEEVVDVDEHPRPGTTLEALGRLRPAFREDGTVTAGNSSGINDGAAALVIASESALERHGLTAIARIVGSATAGVPPRIMGIGPVPATRKLLERIGWTLDSVDVIELNEAFASQALACLRELGISDDAEHVNPNGGAIALGHPTGMSGARITGTAALEMSERGGRRALATMCIGVGQGIAIALEAV
ncbi:MAG TPA: 3-oxoadipyl-CoA thiolase [Acidimicrobiia bacterium]|nr:3-oxoadipyl-CoA thiolase [Acidimicrobiia bacterium]